MTDGGRHPSWQGELNSRRSPIRSRRDAAVPAASRLGSGSAAREKPGREPATGRSGPAVAARRRRHFPRKRERR